MNWDREKRQICIRDFLLSNFSGLLHCIDEDTTMSPSQVVEWADHMYELRGEDKLSKEGNVYVAFGCLAGVILLYFKQFLHKVMIPKLQNAKQMTSEKTTDEIPSIESWTGFEEELLNKVETKLSEWGSVYGISKLEAGMRINSLLFEYKKSGCTILFHKGLMSAEKKVFLYEENFQKYTSYCEPVAMWLCSPIQNSLHGLLEGFFNNVLEQILENDAKGWI